MQLHFISSVVILSGVICYRSSYSLNIQQECIYKYEVKSQWNTTGTLLIDCFISPNWPSIEMLNISIHNKHFFLRKDAFQDGTNSLLVPKPSVGWTSILVQRSNTGTIKFEDVFGNNLLRKPFELMTQKPILNVTLSGNMFGFINCPKIRNFFVSIAGTEGYTIPVTFFNGLTKFTFSADKVDSFKLKILSQNKEVQVFVCKKSVTSTFLEVRPNGESNLCQMFKKADYNLILNISNFDQSAFAERGNESAGKIVILATEGNFYLQANTSYEEADFLIEKNEQKFISTESSLITTSTTNEASNATSSDSLQKIYKLLPLIIVSSILCLVLLGLGFGAYCYYRLYQKNQNIKNSQQRAATNSLVSNVGTNNVNILYNMTPRIYRTRTNHSLGLKYSSSNALRPPPIPEEQEEDSSMTGTMNQPGGKRYNGTYVNPQV